MKTKFEQAAHDIQYTKKSKPSHPHTIETYTGNNNSTFVMLLELVGTFVLGFVLMALIMAITAN